jgi:hypothetical protein
MATVWAYRVSAFRTNPKSGWSHTINFSSLPDLVSNLDDAHLHGGVEQLAIVAHGDFAGQVHMDGRTAVSARSLSTLAPYLTSNAMLIFVSCIAGAGDTGSSFLTSVSRELPGRVIIGFSTWGFVDTTFGAPNDPGNVQAAPGGARPKAGTPRLTSWGSWAKWAYRGEIVRLPADEQKKRPGRRCASPRCPGHSSEQHRCDWLTDPTLRSYQP